MKDTGIVERERTLLNIVFLSVVFLPNPWVIVIAYSIWVVVLIDCLRKMTVRLMKVVFGILIAYAVSIVVLNILRMLSLI